MIAFDVSLNGKKICTAGAEDLGVLTASVVASGQLGKKTTPVRPDEGRDVYYNVGGLTSRKNPQTDMYLRWKSISYLQIGDVLEIKVIETDKTDKPKHRKRAERKCRKS